MTVRVITDSASDIVGFDHASLTVLPLTVAFGDTVYRDGVDLSSKRFFELLVESDEMPSTGAVAPGAFAEAFDRAHEAGEDVVAVTLSSRLSGTWQSAMVAARVARGCMWWTRSTCASASRYWLSTRSCRWRGASPRRRSRG